MEIIVKENRQLIIKDSESTQNENDIQNIKLIVPPQYEDFDKKIAFVTEQGVKWGLVENNMYKLERSITKFENVLIYVWLTKDDQDFRSVEETLNFNKNHKVDGEITPEEKSSMEEAIAVLESEISKVEHMDIDAIKEENIATITITDKLGNQKVIHISDGENGADGENGFSPTIRKIKTTDGYDLEITDISGTNTITISNGKDGKDGVNGQDGQPGKDGSNGYSPTINTIQTADGYNIEITDINGTRTITITNGQDGKNGLNGQDGKDGIDGKDGQDGAKGEKGDPGSPGATGNGIVSIVKTSTSGLVDTYTITFTDGTSTTFQVTNGQNGQPGANGQDGRDGTDGVDGQDGQDGYTPIRGTDYWTATDIAAIESYCANYIDANINQAIGGSY